ncbi:MAG: EAL domain-containing protein [Eubacterium sp.]|nr:EAL domain-containing protein [Eubacterium sp.]
MSEDKKIGIRKWKKLSEDPNIPIEVKANRYTLYCLNYALIALIFVWILNICNVFIVDQKLMLITTLLALIFLLLPNVVCLFAGTEGSWVKYLILFSISTATAIYGVGLSYHAILLFLLPIAFSAQYQSRRVMLVTYVYVLLTMLISVVCSFWLGLCDMNMLFLSAFRTEHYADFATGAISNLSLNPNPGLTVPLFFFIPRAIILLIFIPIFTKIVDMSAENALMMDNLRRFSEVDRPTRFYNKNKFETMIANYYPSVEKVGVIFWDLNNLKVINDTYGHTQGDIVISTFAGCVSELVVNMRQVFRIGGDEFVMMLEDPEEGEIQDVVREVRERIDQYNSTSRIHISAAVGWAEGFGSEVSDVIDKADQNMYTDKGLKKITEVPKDLQDTLLSDRLFEGLASVSDNLYIYLCDMRTNISRWSASAVEYFDMPGEFMKDAGEIWLHKIHPEDRKSYEDDIERVFSGQGVYHKCEYRAVNRYGEYVWLECRGNVIYDEVRQSRYFTGIMVRMDNRNKYDPLTKLKTLVEFNNYRFDAGSGSLLLIGLDDFRKVVNNFGYAYGNTVLAEFSQRLLQFCGNDRIPFRMEGDEFLVLSPGASEEDTIKLFKSLQFLGHGVGKEGGQLINVRFSCGAVLFPDNGTDREELIGNLEHSLELAKSKHRGDLVFFHEDIAIIHQRTHLIKERISKVAREGFEGFSLHFQPIVRSRDHKVVSCEALLRCNDLEKQGIYIGDVINHLEKSGQILEIGRWVTEQVFMRAHMWQRKYPGLDVGFNVSAVQLQNPGFVNWLIRTSRDFEVDPTHITIEITESSRIEDYYTTAEYLNQLREHGFKISLDDFGIAYSTLVLIKALPADSVKIDHTFVLNLHRESNRKDLVIVEAVIDLCRKLNINVVAEGVENAEILRILEQYPIAYFQGFYFSQPLREEEFMKQLDETFTAERNQNGGKPSS